MGPRRAPERGDTLGVARTPTVLRESPLSVRSCRPLRGLRQRGVKKECSAARYDPDLGLTPPGHDLLPHSELGIFARRRAQQNRDERSVRSI